MAKEIQIGSAREIIAEHTKDQGTENVWPQRCGTSRILLENDKGQIIRTDLFFSVALDEDGKFDCEAANPVVVHNTDDGKPQHQYMICQARDRGRNANVREWVKSAFSAFAARFMDTRIPPKEKTPETADELSNPAEVPI